MLISRQIPAASPRGRSWRAPAAAGSLSDCRREGAGRGGRPLRAAAGYEPAVRGEGPEHRRAGPQAHMASGTAFVAESPNGVTALVLRGSGDVQFAPADPAEQVQLRLFSRQAAAARPKIDAMFVRMNPAEFVQRVSAQSLTPMAGGSGRVPRARRALRRQDAPHVQHRPAIADARALVARAAARQPDRRIPHEPARLADVRPIACRTRRRRRCSIATTSATSRCTPRRSALSSRGRFYSEDDGAAFDVEHYRAGSDVRSGTVVGQRARVAARSESRRRR